MACFGQSVREIYSLAGEAELIDSIEEHYEDICSRRSEGVFFGEAHLISERERVIANCEVLRQTLLHRVERLMVSAGTMVTDHNVYGLALIIRGHYEATAMLGYFCDRLVSLQDGNIPLDVFQSDIAYAVMGARHEFFKEAQKPPNILSCIEKAERFMVTHMGFGRGRAMLRDNYEWLSEFCHPNFLSHSVAMQLDKPTHRMLIRHGAAPRTIELSTMGYLDISAALFVGFFDAFLERCKAVL